MEHGGTFLLSLEFILHFALQVVMATFTSWPLHVLGFRLLGPFFFSFCVPRVSSRTHVVLHSTFTEEIQTSRQKTV